MTDAAHQTPDQRRRFGLIVLGLGVVLLAIIVIFSLVTGRPWMLAAAVLIAPNVVVGVRELRAARAAGTTEPVSDN